MKYSQQFQLDLDSLSDNNGHDDRAADAMPGSSWKKESTSNNGRNQSSWNDSMTNAFDSQKKSVNHSILGKMAVDRILEKDFDEIDYDTELEAVWDEEQVKQRKFYQALRRDLDRDFVCTNCGERGHRARNCLVPQICSNCGNLGHRHDQCKFKRSPETIDEFLRQEEEKRKKSRKMRKKAARAVKNPGLPRPKDLPTSDFHKRNDCLRKELDAELKAYADKLEKQAQKRRELKAQKEQEQI
ncbi:hypothetical protein PsorP6_008873 [Peronosclerospora sorghi]|uniref:Uncharacterized protein n=1 Tax=Peronosclerospora sorghi TaxID=230839 RepID=A0ACC0W155_9STRA|nr:hypothetical protein PsorP6_008873 [Peronosclerospora sorghi]